MNMADVLKWIEFSRQILPLALAATGKVPTERIAPIVAAVGDAETALGPGTGTDKLAAVVAGEQSVMQASGASQATIDTVTAAVTSGLSTGIAVVNAVHQIHQAPPAPATAPPTSTL